MMQRVRDWISNWLENSNSIQFDTDMPLQDCLRRLSDLAGNPDAAGAINLRQFALQPDEHQRYRLRMELATLPRVHLEALIWQDAGITFVNGEVIVYRKYMLYPALMVAAAVLVWVLIVPSVELLIMSTVISILVILGIIGVVYPTADYRTVLINLVYDLLDHEQATRIPETAPNIQLSALLPEQSTEILDPNSLYPASTPEIRKIKG